MLELADPLLPLAEKFRQEKYQREFHQLRRLRDHRSQPEPSARSPLHQTETWHVEQRKHHDRRDEQWHRDSAKTRQRELREQHQEDEPDDDMGEVQLEKMERVAFFLDTEKVRRV